VTLKGGERFRYELYETSKNLFRHTSTITATAPPLLKEKRWLTGRPAASRPCFYVNEGILERFGETNVSGNKDIKTKDIAAEIVFKPGSFTQAQSWTRAG